MLCGQKANNFAWPSRSLLFMNKCDSLSPPMQAMVGDDPALHDRWNTHSLFESVPIFMRCLYISHIFFNFFVAFCRTFIEYEPMLNNSVVS